MQSKMHIRRNMAGYILGKLIESPEHSIFSFRPKMKMGIESNIVWDAGALVADIR